MSGIIGFSGENGNKSGTIGSKPNFKVGLGTSHTLTADSYITVNFDTEHWDIGNNFNNTSSSSGGLQPYSFKAPTPGKYCFTWIIGYSQFNTETTRCLTRFNHWDSGASIVLDTYADINGVDDFMEAAMGGGVYAQAHSTSANMKAGEFACLSAYFSPSGTQALWIGNTHTTFCGWYESAGGR